MISEQIIILLLKNFKCAIRSKEIFLDAIPPLICGLVIAFTTTELNKIILSFPFISFTRTVVYNLVNEKAERHKEIQKIMGLETIAYNMGWMIFFYIRAFIASFFFLIPAAAKDALTVDSFDWIQASVMYFFNIALHINFAFFFSTLFSRPRIASEIYMLFALGFSLMYYVGINESNSTNESTLYAISFFFPQSAMIISWLGAGWQGFNTFVYFTFGDAFIFIVAMSLFYFVAFIYCDQVVKTEFGSHKHPLFFLQDLFKRKDSRVSKVQSQDEIELVEYQDSSSATYHEQLNTKNHKQSVQIKNLSKSFGKFKAVDNISFSLFEKQIFCLLGHNGAGKTTTLSMLTGLLEKTSGAIKYYGKDIDSRFEEIRQFIGLCTQKDSLYDNLTIEEHLRFMGQLKGKFFDELEKDVEHTISKCALINQVGKTAGILSGGNKRKLSMAMSIIGGSKVIFLDEPSSGLDSLSRIQIRDIINEIRDSEKTIVLTTHHLEEVEELADRTAIMSKGKLLILGSNDFIKKNFSAGYHLTLSKKSIQEEATREFLSEQQLVDLKNLVVTIIPDAKHNPQSAKGTLLMNLSYSAKDQLLNLFKTIEEQYPQIQITLEVNSLEDAFVNIGMEEENKSDENLNNQDKFTDFNQIQVPECVKKPPVFRFFNQLWALFLRRVFVSMKSVAMIFTFIFPLLIQIGGVILTQQVDDPKLVLPKEISLNKFTQLFLNASFQILSYSLTLTGIAASPVIDNEYRLRYALTVMGCRNTPYWLGAFIFDVMIMLAMFGIFIILVPAIGLGVLEDNMGPIVFILMVSIVTYIGFSYLFSYIYKKSKWVYITYPFVLFFIFYCGLQALFIKAPEDNITLKYFLCFLSPFLATSNSFISLAFTTYVNKLPICQLQGEYEDYYDWERRVQPGQLCFKPKYDGEVEEDPKWMKLYPGSLSNYKNYVYILIGQGIFYIILAIFIDYMIQNLPNRSLKNEDYSEIEKDQSDVAEEVAQEDQRVADPSCQDKIKISKLYKTYYTHGKPFTAIQNNSFGIDSGEVMGLLGPNGAGKSTTFNIITSLIPKSQGSVKLKGSDVKSGQLDVYQDVGICPQFDSLYENLTVEDHLNLFGRMKGLSGKDLKDSVDYFINVMQLKEYRNRKAGNLSGGNKRKLCVTVALIGGPDLQFFDEPSSGVDPIARRFLWNTLKQSLKLRNSSIVLTTHSMQEAESLCSKIGILVNGKFQCIGSPNFLKKKYGDGYRLIVKTKVHECAEFLEKQILEKISKSSVSTKFDGKQIAFSIPYDNFSFYHTYMILNKLSTITFAEIPKRNESIVIQIQEETQLQQHKRQIQQTQPILDSYQLTEITLEQIFVHFSQQQKSYDEEKEKKIKRKRFFCI